jgi:hypothetical protein
MPPAGSVSTARTSAWGNPLAGLRVVNVPLAYDTRPPPDVPIHNVPAASKVSERKRSVGNPSAT